jgi:hypothetical protein
VDRRGRVGRAEGLVHALGLDHEHAGRRRDLELAHRLRVRVEYSDTELREVQRLVGRRLADVIPRGHADRAGSRGQRGDPCLRGILVEQDEVAPRRRALRVLPGISVQ